MSNFGEREATRYELLVAQAFIDLTEDPFRPGSKRRDEVFEGIRTYHLAFSRGRVAGERVKEPRHPVMYRLTGNVVEVLRLLHDSPDLARHLPQD